MNVLRAEAYLKRLSSSEKVHELYDEDEIFASALHTLFPDFEYPDFSHLSVGEVLQRYERAPRPLVTQAPPAL